MSLNRYLNYPAIKGEVAYILFLNSMPQNQQAIYISECKTQDKTRGFDLEKGVLMRIFLFKLGEDAYKLYWSHHHIIMDGWSLPIILEELFAFYMKSCDTSLNLSLVPSRPYRDYLSWLSSKDNKASLQYSGNYLLQESNNR